jgi:hypothetical protein
LWLQLNLKHYANIRADLQAIAKMPSKQVQLSFI